MPKPKYDVDLTAEERAELETFISRGVRSAQAILRARTLLKVDEGATDARNQRLARLQRDDGVSRAETVR